MGVCYFVNKENNLLSHVSSCKCVLVGPRLYYPTVTLHFVTFLLQNLSFPLTGRNEGISSPNYF